MSLFCMLCVSSPHVLDLLPQLPVQRKTLRTQPPVLAYFPPFSCNLCEIYIDCLSQQPREYLMCRRFSATICEMNEWMKKKMIKAAIY